MAVSIPWVPQPGPQLEAIQHAYVEELFFGGARGGGKSDFLLGDFGMDVPEQGEKWRGIIFRQSYPQLEEIIVRSLQIYPQWFPGCVWKAGTKTWEFPNGAFLRMRFLADDTSHIEYQGHSYSYIAFDELPQWANPTNYNALKATLRGAAQFKRIRSTGNPGGAGHGWVKQHFKIGDYPDGGHIFQEGIERRMFVRSRLQDNKILMTSDPGYMGRLDGLGSPQLVRAWKEGDWNVTLGAFFPEFDDNRHVVQPMVIPSNWTVGRAMDWGSAKPYCVLWFAIVGEDTLALNKHGVPIKMPRGSILVYRELYGIRIKPNGEFEADTGLYENATAVGRKIIGREANDGKIDIAVLDPSCFNVVSGPSIAEQLGSVGAHFAPADNTRIARKGALNGWNMVRERLVGNTEDPPDSMIFFSTSCVHTLRTLPFMQGDPNAPEDIAKNTEDHPADTVRYLCNSRPFVSKRHAGGLVERIGAFQYDTQPTVREPTFNELVAARRRARLNRER